MLGTLYVDIDNTIWDLDEHLYPEMERIFQVVKTYEDHTSWSDWPDWCGKDYWKIFEGPLAPEKVPERVMYDGCADALAWAHAKGFHLHFISHNPKPGPLRTPVRDWLRDNLGFREFDLTIYGARNDKTDTMLQDRFAWGIVDDKPTTLQKASALAYYTFAFDRPLNREVQSKYPEIIRLVEWSEFPELVNVILQGEREFDRMVGVG